MKRFDRKFGAELWRELPESPGVYLFKDAAGTVLYVGKAVNLRRRLQRYRSAGRRKAQRKMRALVREASALEIRPQQSERASLLLENQLIRTLRPVYNVDGAYFFLYPAIGIWQNGRQTVLIFTTRQPEWAAISAAWYGTFRSRLRAKEAFEALASVLGIPRPRRTAGEPEWPAACARLARRRPAPPRRSGGPAIARLLARREPLAPR